MSNNWILYEHISPSGKVYVGITNQPIKKRWKNGLGYINSNYFFGAIRNCCAGGYYCHSRGTWVNINQSGGFIWKYKNKIIKEKYHD